MATKKIIRHGVTHIIPKNAHIPEEALDFMASALIGKKTKKDPMSTEQKQPVYVFTAPEVGSIYDAIARLTIKDAFEVAALLRTRKPIEVPVQQPAEGNT